ncbi:MAG: 1-deoxy-D-xylulose-5-phosphate reductoisomerase [Oscillospiraceae bacterium]|nr:1-deoxy-D-xylulose-5-phosphate reductoisomerase [Oscillospiraceae bacterium]
METKSLSILGSTGSIGRQTLSLIDSLGIKLVAISGNRNVDLLEQQVLLFHPRYVCAVDEPSAADLKLRLAHTNTKVLSGKVGLLEIAASDESDTLLNSVVGVAGLEPTLAAIKADKKIALANKETLVSGGHLVSDMLISSNASIIPVDSEHSAIFQCLDVADDRTFNRIFLTASGGPFYGYTRAQLQSVTVAQALKHPNWSMGSKITVDSATMMNKGLEFIEAMRLFNALPHQLVVAIHRQSIVHSMVELTDNSIIAQLGEADMRLAIQYALTYPKRYPSPVAPLDISRLSKLTFETPDLETFGCLAVAIEAAKVEGLVPATINAANEVAVEAFLNERIGFLDIERIVTDVFQTASRNKQFGLEELLEEDKQTRRKVNSMISRVEV